MTTIADFILTPKQIATARRNLVKARAAKKALNEAKKARDLTAAKRRNLDKAISARRFPPKDFSR